MRNAGTFATRYGGAALVALMLFAAAAPAEARPFRQGSAKGTVSLLGMDMDVYIYRPDCARPALLITLHGSGRNARVARNSAKELADRMCFIVLAPEFDQERFSNAEFWLGGIANKRGVKNPRTWTGNFLLALVDWAREREQARLDYYLIGHSAGGQFLGRVAAYMETDAKRIVLANPSTYVLPTTQRPAPFGFGGMFDNRADAEEQLRHYLAQPVTVFIGQQDRGLSRKYAKYAGNIGKSRYERGRTVFRMARMAAFSRGVPFNWRLIEVPGVAHSSKKMYSSSQAHAALAPQASPRDPSIGVRRSLPPPQAGGAPLPPPRQVAPYPPQPLAPPQRQASAGGAPQPMAAPIPPSPRAPPSAVPAPQRNAVAPPPPRGNRMSYEFVIGSHASWDGATCQSLPVPSVTIVGNPRYGSILARQEPFVLDAGTIVGNPRCGGTTQNGVRLYYVIEGDAGALPPADEVRISVQHLALPGAPTHSWLYAIDVANRTAARRAP